jgi:hypothetical protein
LDLLLLLIHTPTDMPELTKEEEQKLWEDAAKGAQVSPLRGIPLTATPFLHSRPRQKYLGYIAHKTAQEAANKGDMTQEQADKWEGAAAQGRSSESDKKK